jgi:hypothetical protein
MVVVSLYRADRSAVLHAGVGKASFTIEQLDANVLALVRAVLAVRPKGVKGGAATGYDFLHQKPHLPSFPLLCYRNKVVCMKNKRHS